MYEKGNINGNNNAYGFFGCKTINETEVFTFIPDAEDKTETDNNNLEFFNYS